MWKDVSCAALEVTAGPIGTGGVIYQSAQLVGVTVPRQVQIALHFYSCFFVPQTYSISTIVLIDQNSGTHLRLILPLLLNLAH